MFVYKDPFKNVDSIMETSIPVAFGKYRNDAKVL